MNTYGYHITNDSVAAYQAMVRPELRDAMAAEATPSAIRTLVARTLVRAGEWMLSDRRAANADGVRVLPRRSVRRDIQRAA